MALNPEEPTIDCNQMKRIQMSGLSFPLKPIHVKERIIRQFENVYSVIQLSACTMNEQMLKNGIGNKEALHHRNL